MKRIITILVFVMLCGICAAQHTGEMYYKDPSLALKDAQSSFSSGNYEKAINLVKIYSSLTGKEDGKDLLSRAQQCRQYEEKAGTCEENGNDAAAAKYYKSILDINPDDANARRKYQELSGSGSGVSQGEGKTTDLDQASVAGGSAVGASNAAAAAVAGTVPPGAVDLGLSVYWATCNLGASQPEEYGDYYAWGETSTKSKYTWAKLKYCKDSTGDSFSKYNTLLRYGRVDNKTRLDMEDDAAHVKLGGKWRMPTEAEFEELRENCRVESTTMNGVNGWKFTSKKNGRSIFLPAAGCRRDTSLSGAGSDGNYWSSSLNSALPRTAWRAYFRCFAYEYVYRVDYERYYGFSVRPVSE